MPSKTTWEGRLHKDTNTNLCASNYEVNLKLIFKNVVKKKKNIYNAIQEYTLHIRTDQDIGKTPEKAVSVQNH